MRPILSRAHPETFSCCDLRSKGVTLNRSWWAAVASEMPRRAAAYALEKKLFVSAIFLAAILRQSP